MKTADGLELLRTLDWSMATPPPRSTFEWWGTFVRRLVVDGSFVGAGERYPNFVKFRVADHEPSGTSVRLHYFCKAEDAGSIHSHRWPFWAVLLGGTYVQRIYALDDCEPAVDPHTPRMTNAVVPGVPYGLAPSVVHQVQPQGPAVSLVLRGPVKRQQRFIQLADGRATFGVKYETFHDDQVSYPRAIDERALHSIVTDIAELLGC